MNGGEGLGWSGGRIKNERWRRGKYRAWVLEVEGNVVVIGDDEDGRGDVVILRETVLSIRKLARTEASSTGREVCGILIWGDDRQSLWSAPTRNCAKADNEYTVDPEDHRSIVESGVDVAGVYHSHVFTSDEPSDLDRAGMVEGWWYVIYSVENDSMSMTRIDDGEETLVRFSIADWRI